MMVLTLKGKHAFAYMVSLGGFREAYDGPPLDSAKFTRRERSCCASSASARSSVRSRARNAAPAIGEI